MYTVYFTWFFKKHTRAKSTHHSLYFIIVLYDRFLWLRKGPYIMWCNMNTTGDKCDNHQRRACRILLRRTWRFTHTYQHNKYVCYKNIQFSGTHTGMYTMWATCGILRELIVIQCRAYITQSVWRTYRRIRSLTKTCVLLLRIVTFPFNYIQNVITYKERWISSFYWYDAPTINPVRYVATFPWVYLTRWYVLKKQAMFIHVYSIIYIYW